MTPDDRHETTGALTVALPCALWICLVVVSAGCDHKEPVATAGEDDAVVVMDKQACDVLVKVIDKGANKPACCAAVVVRKSHMDWRELAKGTTDNSGQVTFRNVECCNLCIEVTKESYVGFVDGIDNPKPGELNEITLPLHSKEGGQLYIIRPDGTSVKWTAEEDAKIPPCGPDTPEHTTCTPVSDWQAAEMARLGIHGHYPADPKIKPGTEREAANKRLQEIFGSAPSDHQPTQVLPGPTEEELPPPPKKPCKPVQTSEL